jgi:hypothetical protein
MRIKGIDKKAGRPIEWSAEEKPVVMVRDHVPTLSIEGEDWWAENIKVISMNIINGGHTEKGFANHTYVANGTYNKRVSKHNRPKQMLQPQPMNFKITIKDIEDRVGMPDMDVKEFEHSERDRDRV